MTLIVQRVSLLRLIPRYFCYRWYVSINKISPPSLLSPPPPQKKSAWKKISPPGGLIEDLRYTTFIKKQTNKQTKTKTKNKQTKKKHGYWLKSLEIHIPCIMFCVCFYLKLILRLSRIRIIVTRTKLKIKTSLKIQHNVFMYFIHHSLELPFVSSRNARDRNGYEGDDNSLLF